MDAHNDLSGFSLQVSLEEKSDTEGFHIPYYLYSWITAVRIHLVPPPIQLYRFQLAKQIATFHNSSAPFLQSHMANPIRGSAPVKQPPSQESMLLQGHHIRLRDYRVKPSQSHEPELERCAGKRSTKWAARRFDPR
jgi:hypothetical protein